MNLLKSKIAKVGGLLSILPIIFALVFSAVLVVEEVFVKLNVDLDQKVFRVIGDKEKLYDVYKYVTALSITYLKVISTYFSELLLEREPFIVVALFACAFLYMIFIVAGSKKMKLRRDGSINGHNVAITIAFIFTALFTVMNFLSFAVFKDVGQENTKVVDYFTYGFLVLAILGFCSTASFLIALIIKAERIVSPIQNVDGQEELNSVEKREEINSESAFTATGDQNEEIEKLKKLREEGKISNEQFDKAVNELLKKM